MDQSGVLGVASGEDEAFLDGNEGAQAVKLEFSPAPRLQMAAKQSCIVSQTDSTAAVVVASSARVILWSSACRRSVSALNHGI